MNSVQFRAISTNDNGVPYYKTHKGAVAGAILAVPAVAVNLHPLKMNEDKINKVIEAIEKIEEPKIRDFYKEFYNNKKEILLREKKLAIPFAIAAGVLTLGSGLLYDKIRNKKAKAAANDIMRGDYNSVYANGGEVATSATGAPYYKSTNAAKFGALTGAVCGLAHGAMSCIAQKKFVLGNVLSPLVTFTLGGMLMSAIAQKASNKGAEKNSYIA